MEFLIELLPFLKFYTVHSQLFPLQNSQSTRRRQKIKNISMINLGHTKQNLSQIEKNCEALSSPKKGTDNKI